MAVEKCGICAYIHRRAVIPDSAATRIKVVIDEAELGVEAAVIWEARIIACDRQFSPYVARGLSDSAHIGGNLASGIRRCPAAL